MRIEKQQIEQGWLFYNPAIWQEVSSDYFEPRHWQQNRAVLGQAKGRGKALFFRFAESECVLRHYYRGGMAAKLSHDKYLYTGLRNSRVWREFKLLTLLQKKGLPAPAPIGGRLLQQGCGYRADIILERIAEGDDLGRLLSKERLTLAAWRNIGVTIARFHKAGIYHADLNLSNIMLDLQGKVWLIDWDNGCVRSPRKHWQKSNLARFRRSLDKALKNSSYCHWLETDWQVMLDAYNDEMSFK